MIVQHGEGQSAKLTHKRSCRCRAMEQPEMVLPAERARGPSVCCTGRPLAHAAWKPFGDMARWCERRELKNQQPSAREDGPLPVGRPNELTGETCALLSAAATYTAAARDSCWR